MPASEVSLARKQLLAIDLHDADGWQALGELAATPAGVEAARDVALGGPGKGTLAAAIVLAGEADDAEPFRPLVDDPDPRTAALAAAAVAQDGEKAGLARLIDLLAEPGVIPGFDPPEPVWMYAADHLARLTGLVLGPPFDADHRQVAAAAAAWKAWWAEHGGRVRQGPDGMWRA